MAFFIFHTSLETDLYKTIKKPSEGLYKEKGSKFLSFAVPVISEEEFKFHHQKFSRAYHDARHICYAYRLGPEKKIFRANDDGEPSGTAGKPILGQIQAFDLTNIAVFVIRYFGGILLGTGGLTVAYRESAASALRNAEIISLTWNDDLILTFDYQQLNDVMKILKNENIKILSQNFDSICTIKISIRKRDSEKFYRTFKEFKNLTVDYVQI